MKTCPVCNARAFDDAEVCYGCMYRFGEEPEAVGNAPTPSPQEPPEFRIRFIPLQEQPGIFTWKCAIEA